MPFAYKLAQTPDLIHTNRFADIRQFPFHPPTTVQHSLSNQVCSKKMLQSAVTVGRFAKTLRLRGLSSHGALSARGGIPSTLRALVRHQTRPSPKQPARGVPRAV